MKHITLSEEDLIDLIKTYDNDYRKKKIIIKERCLTYDGGFRLYFEVDD